MKINHHMVPLVFPAPLCCYWRPSAGPASLCNLSHKKSLFPPGWCPGRLVKNQNSPYHSVVTATLKTSTWTVPHRHITDRVLIWKIWGTQRKWSLARRQVLGSWTEDLSASCCSYISSVCVLLAIMLCVTMCQESMEPGSVFSHFQDTNLFSR